MTVECHYKEIAMKLPDSFTCSSQNSVLSHTDVLAGKISASTEYLTEKLNQDMDTSSAMQEEIFTSKDNFSAAIQAIHDLTESFAALSESAKLLGEIAAQTRSLTMSTAAEPVNPENALKE